MPQVDRHKAREARGGTKVFRNSILNIYISGSTPARAIQMHSI